MEPEPKERKIKEPKPKKPKSKVNGGPSIKLCFSTPQNDNPNPTWHSFIPRIGTYGCLSLASGVPHLQILRLLGEGTTGVVYEAGVKNENGTYGRKVAVKLAHARSESNPKTRERLRSEFRIYQVFERAYHEQQVEPITPRCFGIFENKRMAASVLVLELLEPSLPPTEWEDQVIDQPAKAQIYELVRQLHELGIKHNGLEPRNVARAQDGTWRIFDFSASSLHDCLMVGPGKAKAKASTGSRRCGEPIGPYARLLNKPIAPPLPAPLVRKAARAPITPPVSRLPRAYTSSAIHRHHSSRITSLFRGKLR